MIYRLKRIRAVLALLLFGYCAPVSAQTVLSVENSPVFASNLQNYWFYIRVDDVTRLFAYSITVTYDATKIDVLNIISDDFLGSQGALTTSFVDHSTPGVITVDESILGMLPVTTSGGRVVSVQFKAKQANVPFVVPITFTGCLMRDELNNPVACSSITGYIYLFHSRVRARAFLQGPFVSVSGAMHTQLRNQDYPEQRTAPYTQDPVAYGEQLPASAVDWALVELRGTATGPVLASKVGFIKTDGNIVFPSESADADLPFPVTPGSYYIVVRHRNHLAVQSASTHSIGYSAATVCDFTTAQTQAWGTNPMVDLGSGRYGLWAGDVNGNGQIKYNGAGNDRLPILSRVGNVQSAVANGYYPEDVNLNGQVKYNGAGNDRIIILNNLGNIQSATRNTQVP